MAEGRLGDATTALDDAKQMTTRMSAKGRGLIEGLVLRHQGTIEFMRGELDRAEEYFCTLEKAVSSSTAEDRGRLTAIAQYKRARVLQERIREWEPVLCLSMSSPQSAEERDFIAGLKHLKEPPPDIATMTQWSKEVDELLRHARTALRQRDQGDRKWFPAIDIARRYASLLNRRLINFGSSHGNPDDTDADSLPRTAGDGPQFSASAHQPAGRRFELEVLAHSYDLQTAFERRQEAALLSSVEIAHVDLGDECRGWDSDSPFAYKRSWAEYEGMYYLWRSARLERLGGSTLPLADRVREETAYAAAARSYRLGTSLLYARGMDKAARSLHYLVLVCFADRQDGLQERLEATVALFADTDDRQALVKRMIDQIAREALAHAAVTTDQRDLFFTIPTKVICRFVGAHDRYRQVVKDGAQPDARVVVALDRALLLGLAKELAVECMLWYRSSPDWRQLAREALVPEGDIERCVSRVQKHAAALHDWLHSFNKSSTVTPGRARSPAIPGQASEQRRRRRRRGR
jgi:hypothetical protein